MAEYRTPGAHRKAVFMSDIFQVPGPFLRPRVVLKFAVALGCLLFSAQSHAQRSNLGTLESEQHQVSDPHSLARLTVAPLMLSGGSNLTVVSPAAWSTLSDVVGVALESTHRRLTNLFGTLPPVSTSVRLMTSSAFTRATGAPEWTNALYVRGQILIPVSAEQINDHNGISRSVSHEYTHAVIAALSNGKAPGWLDEGLAQWLEEGDENPILKSALYEWLTEHDPIPLASLQGGFTRLPNQTVPAAYAQSLLSSTVILNTYGFGTIRKFFDKLAAGDDQSTAIRAAFGTSSKDLEDRLARTLRRWHGQQHSHGATQALNSTQMKNTVVKHTTAKDW